MNLLCRTLQGAVSLALLIGLPLGEASGQAKREKKADTPKATAEQSRPQRSAPKIKSIVKEELGFKFGTPEEPGTRLEVQELNTAGKPALVITYDNGEIHQRTIFTYDAAGNLTGAAVYDRDSVLISRKGFKYDRNLLVEEDLYDDDNELAHKRLLRYENGKLQEEVMYERDGGVEFKRSYKYDASGNLAEVLKVASDGHVEEKVRRTYDAKGKVLEDVVLDDDDRFQARKSYTYDETGRLLTERELDEEGSVTWQVAYIYDQSGNMTERTETRSNAQVARETFVYDKGGRCISSSRFNDENELEAIVRRKYDQEGSLVEEIEYDRLNEPRKMLRYIVAYY